VGVGQPTSGHNASIDSTPTLDSKITGAFRRTQAETDFSLLDYAVAAAEGTSSELETMRRYYRLVNQRIKYFNPDIQDDTSLYFLPNYPITVDEALTYSKPGTALPVEKTLSGECTEFGTSLVAIARAGGVLSRVVSSEWHLGGWSNHVFAEAFLPNLPQHGGRTTSSKSSPLSDTDHWYAFDATDPEGGGSDPSWTVTSESMTPRSIYGRSTLLLRGPTTDPVVAATTPTVWDPFATDSIFEPDLSIQTAAYMSGPEYWLTESGATGWLGFGAKDVYRINKTTTGEVPVSSGISRESGAAVEVRAWSGGAYFLALFFFTSSNQAPIFFARLSISARTSAKGLVWPSKKARMASG
jgi:hypothetical protein